MYICPVFTPTVPRHPYNHFSCVTTSQRNDLGLCHETPYNKLPSVAALDNYSYLLFRALIQYITNCFLNFKVKTGQNS